MAESALRVTFTGGIDYRQFLENAGLSKSQMTAKAVTVTEEAIANNEISSSETAKKLVSRLSDSVRSCSAEVLRLKQDVRDASSTMAGVKRMVDSAELSAREMAITDSKTLEGIATYAKVLDATKDAFGAESMTEAVICKAIEAASYAMWRSIMGPKFNDRAISGKDYQVRLKNEW